MAERVGHPQQWPTGRKGLHEGIPQPSLADFGFRHDATIEPRFQGFYQADDETRTHDVLHGKPSRGTPRSAPFHPNAVLQAVCGKPAVVRRHTVTSSWNTFACRPLAGKQSVSCRFSPGMPAVGSSWPGSRKARRVAERSCADRGVSRKGRRTPQSRVPVRSASTATTGERERAQSWVVEIGG